MTAFPANMMNTGEDAIVPGPREQESFREALHSLEAIVWEMEVRTWCFTYVSDRAERMFGYPLERWGEAGFWQRVLVDERDRDWCVGFCQAATEEGRNHGFLYRALTADGRSLWVRDLVRVIKDEAGDPTLLRGVMLDVTKEVEQRGRPTRLVLDFESPRYEALRRVLAA